MHRNLWLRPLHISWKGGDENAGRSGKQDFNAGCQRNKVSDEFKAEIKKMIDAEDDKEGAKQALIEGYEGEGGIDELRDYDGITVTSDWTGEAMVSEIEIDPDKVDFDDIKNSEDLGEICKMIKTYSPTLFIKNMEKNGFKEVK